VRRGHTQEVSMFYDDPPIIDDDPHPEGPPAPPIYY
jgi:hypothetical protein